MFSSKDIFLTPPAKSGYTISRSLRFRSSASAYLNRTIGTPTNNKICTFSFWAKRGSLQPAGSMGVIGTSGGDYIDFNNDNIEIRQISGGGGRKITSAIFRDPSSWYHFVFQLDTTDATAANRIKIWQNGVQLTSFSTSTDPSQNSTWSFNVASAAVRIGTEFSTYFDGYFTEINFIDGQALTPSSFGAYDTTTGVWQPKKYTGTYGTNGFYLPFSNNTSTTTLGADSSGNGNNWTCNNISLTAGSTYDSMTDVPTLTSETVGNYCTWNPLPVLNGRSSATFSNANLNATGTSAEAVGTISWGTTGKYYFEQTVGSGTSTSGYGVSNSNTLSTTDAAIEWSSLGGVQNGSAVIITLSALSNGDVLGFAVDVAGGTLAFYRNGTLATTITTAQLVSSGGSYTNFFNMTPFFRSALSWSTALNCGQRPFTYTAPTGFVALNTYNLPASTISNGANYMAATTYTGTGASQAISNAVNGVSFQPDFVWAKQRGAATDHVLYDVIRTGTYSLTSNNTAAEVNQTSNGCTVAFASTGFTAGADTSGYLNYSGRSYVGWQWKAGTTSSSNTSGTITSTVSVNTTAGFSVVTYTGTGSAGTIGHGLGVAPQLIIVKPRSATVTTDAWNVYHVSTGNTNFLVLNATDASTAASNRWNNTSPTSSVFSIGTVPSSVSVGYVAYCFAAVAGYSAFGSYTGNGSTNGPFIYLGFRPRFVLFKRSDSGAYDWVIIDTSRDTYNASYLRLLPNSSAAEDSSVNPVLDCLSNGFKIRTSNNVANTSGGTYIYAAFAENPFKNALAR